MRVVLDTNIFISGLMLPQGVPGKVIAAWRGGQFGLVLSEPMLVEFARVLAYPKIRKRIQWGDVKIAQFVDLLRFEAEIVDIVNTHATVPQDPDDSLILATFIAGQADCLVTGDDDLLSLAKQYTILTPAAFMSHFF